MAIGGIHADRIETVEKVKIEILHGRAIAQNDKRIVRTAIEKQSVVIGVGATVVVDDNGRIHIMERFA